MPLIPLVVVADEGYLFDELTDHAGVAADINTAITVRVTTPPELILSVLRSG